MTLSSPIDVLQASITSPELTLRRRRNYGLSKRDSHAHQQLLSPAQEEVFAHWIVTLEADGHAPTHNTLREMAGQISLENGGPATMGKKWLRSF
jgi:Tc5 transposase DNA-binding domain